MNVGIGRLALSGITTGGSNVGVGMEALTRLTGGSSNFALGGYALANLTTSGQNVAIGYLAGTRIQTGDRNILIGYQSGYGAAADQTGVSDNVCIGNYAGKHLSTGQDKNVLIGSNAGINCTGDDNTMIGFDAGYGVTSGVSNIIIGHYAGYRQTTLSNLLIVDNQLRADAATEQSNAILYGVMAATPAGQTLRINATATISGDLDHDGSNVGFYGTAPVAKQTGVAVTAAGIHAALVNLGLIAA